MPNRPAVDVAGAALTANSCCWLGGRKPQAASDKARTYRIGAIRYIQKSAQLEEFLNKVGHAVKEMLSVREMPEPKRPSE